MKQFTAILEALRIANLKIVSFASSFNDQEIPRCWSANERLAPYGERLKSANDGVAVIQFSERNA
jgi:hypothetical protein